MKRNKTLVNILHRLFALLFWITTIIVIYVFAFEIFTKDGRFGNFMSENHHSNGYSIPVRQKVQLRNIFHNNFKTINNKIEENSDGIKWKSGSLEYFNKMPDTINTGTYNIVSFYYPDEDEVFTTNESVFYGEGYLIVKSSNWFVKSLQIFKLYLMLIAMIFVFYFLKQIFASLRRDFSFNNFLYVKVKWLGIIIILKTVIELIINYVLGQYFDHVISKTLVDGKIFSQGINLTLNPRLDFEFTLFLVGLSLLVLANLLKAGNSIQQENNLTI